jgi:hypothetical protein
MKWFHHECTARHDPKLQMLGDSFGIEGIGIYWALLEEIGGHSDTFHLKVTGLSSEIDQMFSELCLDSRRSHDQLFLRVKDLDEIPKIPLRLVARQLFTSSEKIESVISLAVEIGLFDSAKWMKYNVLYSSGFEHRADDYTRRQIRRTEAARTGIEETPIIVRGNSEDGANPVRTKSDKVLLDTEAEEKESRSRRREEKNICSAERQEKLSTKNPQETAAKGDALIQLMEPEILEYCKSCYDIIREWNEIHERKFEWQPTEVELKKLFLGGERSHKINLCYQAINVQGGEVKYTELVLRAIRLMLDASTRQRITNPFGWVWSCLNGNGDGTTPWVALLTSAEESNNALPSPRGG